MCVATKRLISLLSLTLVAACLSACSWSKNESDVGGPLRVQIPFAINGKYSLQIIDLFTLESLTDFRGRAVRFLMDPDTVSGRLQGRPPQLRYIRNTNGVIVPKDDLSLQLLTVYAHYERLQILDEKVGAKGLLAYPRTVAVNAQYRSDSGQLENNALYSGQYDALLLVPYTQSALPIMANGGVLAHEHFHALFQRLLIQTMGASYPGAGKATVHDSQGMNQAMGLVVGTGSAESFNDGSVSAEAQARARYHAVLLRGVNEGLADTWGWVYSGDTNFVRQSLPQEKMGRSLDVPLTQMISQEGVQNLIAIGDPASSLFGVSYFVGNQLARAVRGLAPLMAKRLQISQDQVRPLIGQMILKALPELGKKMGSLTAAEILSPSEILLKMTEQIQDLSSVECFYITSLIPANERANSVLDQKCQALLPAVSTGDQVQQ